MTLNKKETRYYKPLIVGKLQEMNVKDEIGYAKTGATKVARQMVEVEGKFSMEKKTVPCYRAANLQRNLTKKLLKLSPVEIERFLATELPQQPDMTESEVSDAEPEVAQTPNQG